MCDGWTLLPKMSNVNFFWPLLTKNDYACYSLGIVLQLKHKTSYHNAIKFLNQVKMHRRANLRVFLAI